MRMAFGLVALLVTIGIVALLYKQYSIPAAKAGKKAQDEVRQLSGYDEDGVPASQSIKLQPQDRSGRFYSLVVAEVTPGGAMEKFFGLRQGDQIIAITLQGARQEVRDMDAALAESLVQQAYQVQGQLQVLRNDRTLTLPTNATASPTQPPRPSNAAPAPRDALQQQLDAIQSPRVP